MELEHNYGLVILAGGDATRLEMDIPKGCVLVHGISLIERLIRKGPKYIAIMASKKNEKEIENLVQTLNFHEKKIFIFSQNSAPFVDMEGEGPVGNGDLFQSLETSGILNTFEKNCLKRIVVCPVDNPLAAPGILELHQSEELIVLGVEKGGQMRLLVHSLQKISSVSKSIFMAPLRGLLIQEFFPLVFRFFFGLQNRISWFRFTL